VGKNLDKEMPTIGAFEIFVEGKLIFSKIKTQTWPNIDRIAHVAIGIEYTPKHLRQQDFESRK